LRRRGRKDQNGEASLKIKGNGERKNMTSNFHFGEEEEGFVHFNGTRGFGGHRRSPEDQESAIEYGKHGKSIRGEKNSTPIEKKGKEKRQEAELSWKRGNKKTCIGVEKSISGKRVPKIRRENTIRRQGVGKTKKGVFTREKSSANSSTKGRNNGGLPSKGIIP